MLDSVFAANDWVTNRLSVERGLKIKKIREIADETDTQPDVQSGACERVKSCEQVFL